MTVLPDLIVTQINQWLIRKSRPLVVGLCGAQGVGKSTLSAAVAQRLNAACVVTHVLSLDDLYLPPEDRPVHMHPLFATRGVPGTHDTTLGLGLIDTVTAGVPVRWPSFDKATDRPLPDSQWPQTEGAIDVLLFEGWCVGARPEAESALIEPVNALERDEDARGIWRRYVNRQLAGPYADLFARLDRLIILAAPGFEVVQGWRRQQEDELRQTLIAQGRDTAGVMDEAALRRFIAHYERLTRHILKDMPHHADMNVYLDMNRQIINFE